MSRKQKALRAFLHQHKDGCADSWIDGWDAQKGIAHAQTIQERDKEITRLRQRVEELEADAERYRWLKAQHNDWESSWRVYQPHPTLGSVAIDQGVTAGLDDVIDAAMESEE